MEDEREIPEASPLRVPRSAALRRPLRCIVKLGGAAVTCKHEIERIDEKNLGLVCAQLRQAMGGGSSGEAIGMDWSRRPGGTGVNYADAFDERAALNLESVVVVHGADVLLRFVSQSRLLYFRCLSLDVDGKCPSQGVLSPNLRSQAGGNFHARQILSGSFGHFQASRSGVHKGGIDMPIVKAGFVATRISVTSLNLEIVRALAREGIPAIAMPPFACGWTTCSRNIASADVSPVIEALDAGFVPVLHGDAVLDNLQGCTILSGDVIIRHIAQQLRPQYVVFLGILDYNHYNPKMWRILNHMHPFPMRTDVWGVYDRPPSDPNAVLLNEIVVHEDGSWSVVKPATHQIKKEVEITVAAHDTTGGMETKISEAATIAKLGINVFITKAGTSHSFRALEGELVDASVDGWLGTAIRPANMMSFSRRPPHL